MPISGIEDVLPKIMEQDAGCGYCYAWHAETSETSGTRPELNSSPAPAFSEAAGVVSTARIERGPSNSLYFSLGEWPRLPFTARIERPPLHRGGSASKKGTWPLPSPSFGGRTLHEHRRSSGSIPSSAPGTRDQQGCHSPPFLVRPVPVVPAMTTTCVRGEKA